MMHGCDQGWQACCGCKRHTGGYCEDPILASYDIGVERATSNPEDAITDFECADSLANCGDNTSAVFTWRAWVAGIHAKNVENVAEVEADRAHSQLHTSHSRVYSASLLEFQHAQLSAVHQSDGAHLSTGLKAFHATDRPQSSAERPLGLVWTVRNPFGKFTEDKRDSPRRIL
eukprot:2008650-Rhodomonas_salina.1